MQAEIELLTCFSPLPHYALEAMCGTSYGMDPRILLALVGYTLDNIDTDIDTLTLDNACKGHLLAALTENLHKVLFIREKGLNLAGDRKNSSTFENLICDHVVGRWQRTKNRGSQHAKVILAIYKNERGDRYGRLYIGSKNLTAGSSREIGVVLELLPNGARKNPNFHRQLVSFFEEGLKPELAGASEIKTRVFELVVQALKDAGLGPSTPGLSFLWQSRHGLKTPLMDGLVREANGVRRIDLHSPWADPTVVANLAVHSTKAPVHLRCLKDPRYGYNKRPHLTVRFDGPTRPTEKLALQQSHAKAYLFSREKTQTLFFGSANFTRSGLGLSRTPNTEVLLRWPSSSNKFKELLQNGAGNDLDDEIIKTPEQTPEEKLRQEMLKVEIDLEYSVGKGELVYHFRNPPNCNITVTHLLLEPISDKGEKHFVVISARTLPRKASFKIALPNFKKVSSRVILSAKHHSISADADLTVDLPPAFYDARSNLRNLAAFRLTGAQLIHELLNIADYPTGSGGGADEGGAPQGEDVWLKWIEKVHLERFLLRLFRMQTRDPKLFEQRRRRLDKVIADLNASDEGQFKQLGETLERVTRVFTA